MSDSGYLTRCAWRVPVLSVHTKGTMTINEIIAAVRPFRPCSRESVRRYLKTLKIERLGVRQKPDQFPGDAGKRVLAHLGFVDSPAPTNGANGHDDGKVVGLRKLKTVRAKSRRKK